MSKNERRLIAHHVDHGASADRGGARLRQVVDLEHEPHSGRQRDALAVRETQNFRVVQYGVKILDPERIDRAVENDPLPVRQHCVDGSVEDHRLLEVRRTNFAETRRRLGSSD